MKVKLKTIEQLKQEFTVRGKRNEGYNCDSWNDSIHTDMVSSFGCVVEIAGAEWISAKYNGMDINGRQWNWIKEWFEYKLGDYEIDLMPEELFVI